RSVDHKQHGATPNAPVEVRNEDRPAGSRALFLLLSYRFTALRNDVTAVNVHVAGALRPVHIAMLASGRGTWSSGNRASRPWAPTFFVQRPTFGGPSFISGNVRSCRFRLIPLSRCNSSIPSPPESETLGVAVLSGGPGGGTAEPI